MPTSGGNEPKRNPLSSGERLRDERASLPSRSGGLVAFRTLRSWEIAFREAVIETPDGLEKIKQEEA